MRRSSIALYLGIGGLWLGLCAPVVMAEDSAQRYDRSVHQYSVPEVTLLSQDRLEVQLDQFLDSGKPVLLDFIFGTCSTICPILSASFTNLQTRLGDEAEQIRWVSISIDPEHDTPEVMKKYLERYRAIPGWDFLTGSREDIELVMRSFEAFVPDKMSHQPLIFLRAADDDEWVRLDGFISGKELLDEYRAALN